MLNEHYFTSKELMYDTKVNMFVSPHDYRKLIEYKKTLMGKSKYIKVVNLKTFNDNPVHYSLSCDLLDSVNASLKTILTDITVKNSSLVSRNFDDITLSRIYSEIEGSLNIESVPTTRKVVDDIAKEKRTPKNKNEQIIKNMIDAIDYVNKMPEFTDENLYKLYNLLSYECLDEEDKLIGSNHYRHDAVEVGGYLGCPADKVQDCMDSLFDFVKENLKNVEYLNFLPHIVHYYILYVHPYFDYNGRTARMVSYWISILSTKGVFPPVISEAISQTKSQYYDVLSETRDFGNDLTYFLTYIFEMSTKYYLVYKNIEEISQELMNDGIIITPSEKAYYKKILVSNKGKFSHVEFSRWININISKQGALKILNKLESYGLLTSSISKSNVKLFEINGEKIRYKFINQ